MISSPDAAPEEELGSEGKFLIIIASSKPDSLALANYFG